MCSDCEVLFVRSLGSSMSSSPPIKSIVPLGRSGLNLLSSSISYQVAREVYLCTFRFVLFPSYSPQKFLLVPSDVIALKQSYRV
jgi:hypothetical protein